jgi:putative hydrolase
LPARDPTNAAIASILERIADLLEAKEESPFRIRSYRNAALSIRESKKRIAAIVKKGGADPLTEIKGIGEKLAGLIAEYVSTGQLELLSELEREFPGGPPLRESKHAFEKPIAISLALVLAIDEDYRKRAGANKLKKIAPRQHNPEKKAWLPIMVTDAGGYRFTVMYSNTARAHELGKTNDWTVVYYEKGKGENQCTVVTETRGPLKGKRVIRGREAECKAHYGVK